MKMLFYTHVRFVKKRWFSKINNRDLDVDDTIKTYFWFTETNIRYVIHLVFRFLKKTSDFEQINVIMKGDNFLAKYSD